MSFDGWLDARDGVTVAREWGTLATTKVELGVHPRFGLGIQPEGAAILAASWLGCAPERFAWFAREEGKEPVRPAPVFTVARTVARCFLDGALDVTGECYEDWKIHEVLEGSRGVQFITVGYTIGPMTREGGTGGSATIVRLFDRGTTRGVSVQLSSREAYTIGEPIDLVSLDLFSHRLSYRLRWPKLELAAVRGFVAQVTADLDAHFDTSTEWEGGVTRDEVLESKQYNVRSRRRELRFQSGRYAIELGENLDPDVVDDESSMIIAKVQGLPWGHEVQIRIARANQPDGCVDGWIDFTLPLAQLEAAEARVAKIPGLELC